MFHIIDDEPLVLQVLKDLIEFKGWHALGFSSPKVYLEYFNAPDYVAPIAILSDYDMPGMNGLQLIKRVRSRLPQQNATIISGNLSPERVQVIQLNSCYMLHKPYHPHALFSLLAMFISCYPKHTEGVGQLLNFAFTAMEQARKIDAQCI